jgi:hypothetical protein
VDILRSLLSKFPHMPELKDEVRGGPMGVTSPCPLASSTTSIFNR